MSELKIRPITDGDENAVVSIWERTGLTTWYNPPAEDLALMRRTPTAELLVGLVDGQIVATVHVGHEGHRGWLYYVGVDPDYNGRGFGKAIVTAGENWLRERSIPKVQLMVRPTNAGVLDFYEKLGYQENPCVLREKWLRDKGEPPVGR
jgi:ribosomal protein S18 acetylase RimI-like enzyme